MGKNKKSLLAAMVFIALLVFGCGVTGLFQEDNTSGPPPASEVTFTPIPGWTKFESKDIEIWLPDGYVGGNISEDLQVAVENLRRLGPEYEQLAEVIEQNPDVLVLWATDSYVGPSGFLTSLTISIEQVISTVTLDTYMDIATQQYPSQFKVVERDKVIVGPHQAGKLVIDFEINTLFLRKN